MNSLPIEHLSYSALRTFCSNPWLFKKHYILNLYDDKKTPSMLVGSGFHKFCEFYFAGTERHEALKKGFELIESISDDKVDWGKTGTREACNKELATVVDMFFAWLPDLGKGKATEYKKTVTPTIDGEAFPLPIKAVTDYITEKEDGLHLWDWKVVSKFTDLDKEDPNKIMQAMFNYFTVQASLGEPLDMTYVEIKKSYNKDKSPQVSLYTIDYRKHPEYFKYFGKMYAGFINAISNPDFQFLPNFTDQLGGDEAWTDFTAEIMDFTMPTQVIHKPANMKNIEQRFVESDQAIAVTPEEKIMIKMMEFGIPLKFEKVYPGANVKLYAFSPSRGVKMSKIEQYDKDLQLALETKAVRILAPIPGTKFIGIEIPRDDQQLIDVSLAPAPKSSLELPIGVDVYGDAHTLNLAKAPHLLVAGSTGSGKSVALSVFINSLIQNNTTMDLGLVLIDPKRSEFVVYEEDQHLIAPIITEADEAETTLQWAVDEMERRYHVLKDAKCRNIESYRVQGGAMQSIVIVIDELADLLLASGLRNKIETSIIRLAQKARAIGIHLIVATQRPSVDVVTGILKANFPTRLAFMTATQVDSKVILDQGGAEKLIGNGDCLLMQPKKEILRLQGYYTQ